MKPPTLHAPDHIRGITLRQPWAACVLHGGKQVENRPRPWAPGWRLLHAGAEIDRAALRDPLVARTVRGRELPTRAVLGVVRITGCHTDSGEACSPWARSGCVHLVLDDVHALPSPVPCGGQLGPWRVPLAVFEQVLVQLPGLAPRLTEVPS
ncbi:MULTISPECIES: ASCH domain-containing protein [Streptomyces]|uniref:ASCH domain-containing protein n=3 Tax=Streptomyces rimosus TaxID=1927 RepID=L8F163_STRR1|nr:MULTISPECIES: hypothetical protein [Streptomyces]KOG73123.1 hypothetical protein ADK78_17890 [Kitasatospora aureofaciens]MYT42014.1 hypothetical protein [Streptomyces sp. SID5471]KEF04899.1 hypothetical protein DF17_21910 [Streptomyces rimosus]KEF10204.1 hypothetical protein DF18_36830 [Streptomyces rimosus]KUJ35186.1 hypothetical protein ADK46_17230 [Streptomyces rimosus subsp. rimosus]